MPKRKTYHGRSKLKRKSAVSRTGNPTWEGTLSPSQAAEQIGVDFYELLEHIREGNLQSHKLGRNIRINPADLEKFAENIPELENKLSGPTQLNIRNIPIELRSQFRRWCSDRGVSMQSACIELIEKAVSGR